MGGLEGAEASSGLCSPERSPQDLLGSSVCTTASTDGPTLLSPSSLGRSVPQWHHSLHVDLGPLALPVPASVCPEAGCWSLPGRGV